MGHPRTTIKKTGPVKINYLFFKELALGVTAAPLPFFWYFYSTCGTGASDFG